MGKVTKTREKRTKEVNRREGTDSGMWLSGKECGKHLWDLGKRHKEQSQIMNVRVFFLEYRALFS